MLLKHSVTTTTLFLQYIITRAYVIVHRRASWEVRYWAILETFSCRAWHTSTMCRKCMKGMNQHFYAFPKLSVTWCLFINMAANTHLYKFQKFSSLALEHCMYVWPLVVVASRNYALLNSVRSCTHRLTVIWVQQLLSSNDKRLTDVGTNEVVPILSASVSLSSLLPLETILCSMVLLHSYPG